MNRFLTGCGAWVLIHCIACGAFPDTVPAPRQWVPKGDAPATLRLDRMDHLAIDSRFRATLEPIGKLYEMQRRSLKMSAGDAVFPRSAPQGGGLFLSLDDTLPHNGYRLEISGSGIIVSAQSAEGAVYAVQTLMQVMARKTPLPEGVLTDYPDLQKRILMLDVGRKPVTKEELKDYIRMMGWFKFNELHLHLNDEAFGNTYAAFRIKTKTYPELAAKDVAYSAEDLRELQDFAKMYAINILPEIDIPGHSEAFVNLWPELSFRGQPTYLDVNNPAVKVRLKKLFDEVIPMFDSSDFHIGTDEYRVKCNPGEKKAIIDDFMNFANEMAAYVESKGKTCRMWYGNLPDHRVSAIKPRPSTILDIWNIHKNVKEATYGNRIIHSNERFTYLVPGAHYYGVDNRRVYQDWKPREVGDFDTTGTDLLVGAKVHVWPDLGPAGYLNTEIAALLLPSLQVFAERMWGSRAATDYGEFQKRAARTLPIPAVKLLERMPPNTELYRHEQPVALRDVNASEAIANAKGNSLEYPWTLSFEIKKAQDTGKRGVIISSDWVEICSDLKMSDIAGGDGDKPGIGVVRASGGPIVKDADPTQYYLSKDTSYSSGVLLPLNQWVKLSIVAEQGKTTFFLDAKKIGETNNQTICPLLRFGSLNGSSFVGEIRNLRLVSGKCAKF